MVVQVRRDRRKEEREEGRGKRSEGVGVVRGEDGERGRERGRNQGARGRGERQ